jgi:hypothetical protein
VKRLLLSILILACIPVSIWLVANLGMWMQVLRYSGDGVIHAAPLMPGYEITFPKFDAFQPYSASYRFSRVPQRKYSEPVIYLRFHWSRGFAHIDEIKKQVTARFRFTLLDGEGGLVQSADLPVSASIWTGGTEFWAIYQDESRLHFRKDASYVLNVSYAPGPVPPPTKELYFSVEDGGTL